MPGHQKSEFTDPMFMLSGRIEETELTEYTTREAMIQEKPGKMVWNTKMWIGDCPFVIVAEDRRFPLMVSRFI